MGKLSGAGLNIVETLEIIFSIRQKLPFRTLSDLNLY
jgi:hypothetical protein